MLKRVSVCQTVKVTIDETKFDEAFLAEFRQHFYQFHSIEDHIKHLAQLYARGICDNGYFIEGYGPTKNMGIRFEEVGGDQEEEILPDRMKAETTR